MNDIYNKCDKSDDSYYLNIGVLECEVIWYDIQFIFLSIIFESIQDQKGTKRAHKTLKTETYDIFYIIHCWRIRNDEILIII